MGKYKQFIIDAHKGEYGNMCSDWREKLEKELPELFKKEFKVGDWAIGWFYEDKDYKAKPWRVGSKSDGLIRPEKNLSHGCYAMHLRKATPEEIKKHLIEEAKKRGFLDLVMFSSLRAVAPNEIARTSGSSKGSGVCGSRFKYSLDRDTLYSWGRGCHVVYEKGKWAEIIPEKKKMTQSDIEKELGYAIEITD